jgi:hypothetical protein
VRRPCSWPLTYLRLDGDDLRQRSDTGPSRGDPCRRAITIPAVRSPRDTLGSGIDERRICSMIRIETLEQPLIRQAVEDFLPQGGARRARSRVVGCHFEISLRRRRRTGLTFPVQARRAVLVGIPILGWTGPYGCFLGFAADPRLTRVGPAADPCLTRCRPSCDPRRWREGRERAFEGSTRTSNSH